MTTPNTFNDPANTTNGRSPFQLRVAWCAHNLVHVGEDAISGLVDLTSPRLLRLAVTITRNQHDAEDAVQAVLVKIGCEPERLTDVKEPWGYLLKMVRNEAVLIARRKKRWKLTGDLRDLLTRCRVDELQQEESYRAIWRALRKLPTTQSEVVVLKIWEELTFAQIAVVLDITPSTAASRYRYAVAKLASSLEKVGHEYFGHKTSRKSEGQYA